MVSRGGNDPCGCMRECGARNEATLASEVAHSHQTFLRLPQLGKIELPLTPVAARKPCQRVNRVRSAGPDALARRGCGSTRHASTGKPTRNLHAEPRRVSQSVIITIGVGLKIALPARHDKRECNSALHACGGCHRGRNRFRRGASLHQAVDHAQHLH